MARTTRKDAPDALKFDLGHLYETRAAWQQNADALRADIDQFAENADHVGDSGQALYETLALVESLENRLDRVNQYAHAAYMADASDAVAQSLADGADTLAQALQTATASVIPKILQASDAQIEAWLTQTPQLSRYANYLQKLMGCRSHRLSAEGERIVSTLQASIDGPNRLYGMLTNADLRCEPVQRADGTMEAVSIDTYLFKLSTDTDRDLRRAAYTSLTSGLKAYEQTLAANYLTHVKTQVSIARLRNYSTAAEMFLQEDGNSIPVDFYHTALEVIMEEAKPIARRYVALQKRVQGIDKVHFYDLAAPLADSSFHITYEEARNFIETGLRPLGETYHQFLRAAMAENRIDLADNHGKFPIPVTLTCYGAPTYILSTWYDLLSDAMVLGHELGHLVHTDFTRTQNRFDADYGMLVAETASTTNEWLLYQHLKQSGDTAQQITAARYLIELDFVLLIGQLFVIEKMQAEIYRRVQAGEAVSGSDVSHILTEYLQTFYGEDYEVDEGDGLFWAMWPQPMYPTLYPYCYSAALCMSGAIVDAIQTDGQAAVDRYLAFLQSAGTQSAPETYAIAGVDMLDPQTLRRGIRRFGAVLDELESLL